MTPPIHERLRAIAPKRHEGQSPPVGALTLPTEMTLWDLNALINEAADAAERMHEALTEAEKLCHGQTRQGLLDIIRRGLGLPPVERGVL